MKSYVTDTHALLWHILENPRLSKTVASIFQQADHNDVHIFIPTIVLVEVIYLIEKTRIPSEAIEKIISLIELSADNYRLMPIYPSTIHTMRTLPYVLIPDMPDRIITATALDLGLPLITKDRNITEANVVTVVW
jgi:PIN domain nuclease of toxin-antitoxin system